MVETDRASVKSHRSASSLVNEHPFLRWQHGPLTDAIAASRDDWTSGRSLKREPIELSDNNDQATHHDNELPSIRRAKTQTILRLPAIDTGRRMSSSDPVKRDTARGSSQLSSRSLPEKGAYDGRAMQQLVYTLSNKVKSSFVSLRKRFADNDPEMKGFVSRQALQRLITTTCGQPVTAGTVGNLLELIGLGDRSSVTFQEFAEKLFEKTGESHWLLNRRSGHASNDNRPATSDSVRSLALPAAVHKRASVDEASKGSSAASTTQLSTIDENEPVAAEAKAEATDVPLSVSDAPKQKEIEQDRPVRTAEEVEKQVKGLFEKTYPELENHFREMDVFNSNRLSVEMMETLFERLHAQPQITRAEILAHLWPRFFLRGNAKLDFWEFCRHFMYTKDSAAFPNSKRHPPRKGDADYLLRSLEVNSDTDLVRSSVRTNIDLMMDTIRTKFLQMDPLRTGSITMVQFRNILVELQPDINEYELQVLSKRYADENWHDRVSYGRFLAPYAARRFPSDHTSQQDKMDFVLTHSTPRVEHDENKKPSEALAFVNTRRFIKHHKDVLSLKYSPLKRAFLSLDYNSTGLLNIVELRTALRLVLSIDVSNEDWLEILNELDTQLSGSVNYRKFLALVDEHRTVIKPNVSPRKLAQHKNKLN